MPSVIDSLILELQLDVSKFNEQQRKAVDSLRTLQEGATKNLKPVQKGFDDLGETFRLMQGRLLAIGALIATGLGFNRLVQDVTKANTELGNLSRTLGMTAQDLSAWENAGKTVGATTDEIAGNMKALNAQIQEFHATGKSSLQALMGQVGIKPLQMNDTPDSVAKRLSEWYAKQPDKAFASHLLQSRGGLSQGMINMIGLGPQELEKRLNAAKQFAPSTEDINQFTKLTQAFGNLMTVLSALERDAVLPLTNVLTKVLNMVTEWLAKVHLAGDNPAEAAGEGAAKLGYGELAPNKSKPSIFSRSWNWLRGRGFGGGDSPGSAPSPNESVQGRFGNWQGTPGGGSSPATGGGGAVSGSLAEQRQRFATELQNNPALRDKVMRIMANEQGKNPEGTQSIVESMMNRAIVRGTTLEKEARWHESEGGYYQQGNMGRGALENPAHRAVLDKAISNALGGSNLSNYATDNSSGALAANERMTGKFQYRQGFNGETFFSPGSAEPTLAKRWNDWHSQVVANDNAKSPVIAGVGPIGSGADRSFRLWQNLGLGSKGALMRGGDSTTNNNSNTATTHIGSMNVTVPPGANPSQYAHGISQKLEQYNNVAQSNTGLN